jgi:uncharacterized protein YndB with AHSA1/START domain
MPSTRASTLAADGERELVMSRVFDAPREMVFDALTQPWLVKLWLFGPADCSLQVCEIDARPGGYYRYQWCIDDEGTVMGSSGYYRAVVQPELIVATERFDEPWYPGDAVRTMILTEAGEGTVVTVTLRYDSTEARDAVLESDMGVGMSASFDRLATLVESWATKRAFHAGWRRSTTSRPPPKGRPSRHGRRRARGLPLFALKPGATPTIRRG